MRMKTIIFLLAVMVIESCKITEPFKTGKYEVASKNGDNVLLSGSDLHWQIKSDTLKAGDSITLIRMGKNKFPQRF